MPFLHILGVAAVLVVAAAFAAADEESPDSFPDGEGRDETFYFCTACHGGALIKQQGLTRDRWSETLDIMTEPDFADVVRRVRSRLDQGGHG